MSDLPRLHSEQAVMRLSRFVSPPFAIGFLWSTTNLAPPCGVLPQYWQVKLSLLNTAKRNLKLAFFLCVSLYPRWPLPLWKPPFRIGRLAIANAARQVLKQFIYDDSLGKPFAKFISLHVGVRLRTSLNSFNFKIRYSGDIFLRPSFLFIRQSIAGYIKNGKNYAPFFVPN